MKAIRLKEISSKKRKRYYIDCRPEEFLKEFQKDETLFYQAFLNLMQDDIPSFSDRFSQNDFLKLELIMRACLVPGLEKRMLYLKVEDLYQLDKILYLFQRIPKLRHLTIKEE